MLQKAGTAVWGGKAEGWEQMTHTSRRERESTVQRVKGRSFPSLLFSTHPQNLFHVFYQRLLLFQIVSQKTAPAEHLGLLCTNLCWCQQWKQNHISKYLSNSGPSILSLFSHLFLSHFPCSFLFISFIDLFFQSPSLGRCGFHTWCEMLFLQRLLTHICKIFSLGSKLLSRINWQW